MNQPLLFSGLAGIITITGILLTRLWHHKFLHYSHFINSFAAGFILGVALTEMLPRAVMESEYAPIYALLGFLFFLMMETFLVVHSGSEVHYPDRRHLVKGYIFFWGLFIHSFLDGIIIAVGFATDSRLGLMTALAVISHQFPEGVTTFSLLLQKIRDSRALALAIVVALATPAGGLIGMAVLPFLKPPVGPLVALVAGSFIYVAATDIIPEIREKKGTQNMVALMAGALFVIILHRFLSH